jgi:hypothetical protein
LVLLWPVAGLEEAGNARAKANLASCTPKAMTYPQLACKLLRRAPLTANGGNVPAVKNKKGTGNFMTPEQLAEAQKLGKTLCA